MEGQNLRDSPERKRRRTAAYENGADGSFVFKNGDEIRINKSILANHSDFFQKVFFGPSGTSKFEVRDFHPEKIQLFLDALLGLENYTVLNCIFIYPIAHRYKVNESLEKCRDVLKKQEVVDENVALTLNLALIHKDDELVNSVINFIKSETGVVDFIGNELHQDILEPISMCRLIQEISLDSFVWKIACIWGESYLKKEGNDSTDISSFFKEIGISPKIEMRHFESIQAVVDFHEKGMFDSNTISFFLQFQMNQDLKVPDKSEWIKLNHNSFREVIEFNPLLTFPPEEQRNFLDIQIRNNKIFYENVNLNDDPSLTVTIKLFTRNIYAGSGGQLKVSPFSYGTDLSQNIKISPGELYFQSTVRRSRSRCLEIESVIIIYDFKNLNKARILKTTLKENFKNFNKLHFTRNVVVSSKESGA